MGTDLAILGKTCTAYMSVENPFCLMMFLKIAGIIIIIHTGHRLTCFLGRLIFAKFLGAI